MLDRIRRGLQKPPRVILARGAQEAVQLWRDRTGGWDRIARRADRLWTPQAARALRNKAPYALFHPDGPDALRAAAKAGDIDAAALLKRAEDIRDRRFSILGAPLPPEGPMPWLSDWRYGHDWPATPERHINHMARRDRPYDVKYPWELSRLHFLAPLLLGAVLEERADLIAAADAYLAGWEAANPLGRTVNWAPMESSMRVISLVLALDLLRAAGAEDAVQARFLAALHRSLVFVRSAVEDTDMRGNHFTANLAALSLGGRALAPLWPGARRYIGYAETRLEAEIALQFCDDGVNFEKSSFYHRLVAELFLLIAHVRAQEGATLGPDAADRLRGAAAFTRWLTGPEGHVPVWGDSDDAEIFTLDAVDLADHRSFLSLAGTVLDGAPPLPLPSGILLSGQPPAAPPAPPAGGRHFEVGGFFVAREPGVQLVTDLGETGMRGRGGHGHNDILSLALWLHGMPVIVDPGSYVYSGDLAARERFRGSAAHSGLTLDGEEIARLGPRPFRIHDDARPLPASAQSAGPGRWRVTGGHTGYDRLRDPARHIRIFDLDAGAGRLTLTDRLEMAGTHRVRRHLQFAPGTVLHAPEERAVRLSYGRNGLDIRWEAGTRAQVDTAPVSRSYAQAEKAPKLCLETAAEGATELTLTLRWTPPA